MKIDKRTLDIFKMSYFYAYTRARIAQVENDFKASAFWRGTINAYSDAALWFDIDRSKLAATLPSDVTIRNAIRMHGKVRAVGVLYAEFFEGKEPLKTAA